MKQTNNAIKFLMAQYRAIFKNANIAMLAAIAASALAAGQAQAAKSFVNDTVKAEDTNVTVDVDGTGTAQNAYDKIALTDGVASDKAFVITVSSGAANNTIKGSVGLSNSTIKVAGADTTNAKLDIGTGANNPTNLTLKELSVAEQGALNVAGTNADNKTSVIASTINFGDGQTAANSTIDIKNFATVSAEGDGDEAGKITINQATVDIATGGTLKGKKVILTDGAVTNAGTLSGGTIDINGGELTNTGTLTAGTLNLSGGTLTATEAVTASNELNIAGGKVDATKAVSGKTIKVTGGEVDFAAETGVLGSDTTDLITISGGTVGATNAAGTIKGKTIKFENGDIKATNALTIEGGFEATGGTITVEDNQTVTFKGNASIADDVTVTLNGTTKHTIKVVGTDDENNGKLSVSAKKFGQLTGGKGTNKVALSGANSSTAELHFTDAAVNFETLGVLTNAGAFGNKIDTTGNAGKIKVSAKEEATFAQKDLTAGITIAAKKLTVGNKANGFTISGAGAALEVGNVLTIGEGTQELKITQGSVSLKADAGVSGSEVKASKITVGSASDTKKGTLTVSAGEWKIGSLVIDSGTASVINDAVLKITGDLTTKNATNQLVAEDSATIDASGVDKLTLAGQGAALKNTSTLILSKDDVFNESGERIDANYAENAVSGDANTTIKIMDGEKLAEMSLAKFKTFNEQAGFNGLWKVKITGLDNAVEPEMNIGGTDNNVQAGLADVYKNTQAKVASTTVIDKNYSVGSVALTEGNNLTIGKGAMTLQNAYAHDNDGMFVSKPGATANDKPTLAGVNFGTGSTADSSLTLQGSGKIGAITTGTAGSGSVTFGAGEGKTGTVIVKGSIGADGSEIGKVIVNGSTVKVDDHAYVENIDVNGGHVNLGAKDLVLGAGDATLASTIDGKVTANELKFKPSSTGTVAIAGGADVDLKKLSGTKGVKIQIGKDGNSVQESSTASVYADTLELGSGSIFVDPVDSLPYSLLAVNSLKQTGPVTDDKVAGELNGTVNVGNNAVFGVGFKNKQEVIDAVAAYTKPTGSLNADHFNSALVLNKPVELAATDGLYVGKSATAASAKPNKVTFESGAGLVITDNVFADVNGNKSGAAITVDSGATVNVSGAKLVFVGDFTGADKGLQIFSGTTSITGPMTSQSANGLLKGELDATSGKMDLIFKRDEAVNAGAFADASEPVRNLLLDKLDGKIAKSDAAGYDLISLLATSTKDGVLADAAAHAATYAGAQQAAVLSVTTMADAMFGRVGAVGVEAASIAATGSQANGGVWLTPMYKSMDSDGFNAQGASYGSDVDLSGVAFGTDTVNGNMRFGAVFNIGSGDAEGKVNGNGLKDEFDYYGFGIYSAMGFGNFALVGDASMTVISHDVEGHGLNGEADTTAVTMGLTGQYTVATPAVDVTPHLGARFIRLNTDSYDLMSADGVLATTDFDVQNVFSVPLGVTLSKGFVAGGWTLAPSADLSVTFNTGDTEAKSTTTFTGVPSIDLTSEVLDEVQYGLTVGLGAQYGAFGTSFGINYTGSSNTDSFGVNAQARYMF